MLSIGQRLPGFGHSVYRNGDPRLAPLLDSVARPARPERAHAASSTRCSSRPAAGSASYPNIDLGLGAMVFVGGLPRDASLFAVARIAGWAAHYDEELTERPVRYRGVTTRR